MVFFKDKLFEAEQYIAEVEEITRRREESGEQEAVLNERIAELERVNSEQERQIEELQKKVALEVTDFDTAKDSRVTELLSTVEELKKEAEQARSAEEEARQAESEAVESRKAAEQRVKDIEAIIFQHDPDLLDKVKHLISPDEALAFFRQKLLEAEDYIRELESENEAVSSSALHLEEQTKALNDEVQLMKQRERERA